MNYINLIIEFDDIMNDSYAHIYPLDSLNSEEIA